MDLNDLQKLLDKAANQIPEKALRVIGVEGKNFIAKNFRDQGFTDTSTEKWKERETIDKKGRDVTRYRTNRKGRAGNLNKYGNGIKDRAILTGLATGGNKLRNSFRYRVSLGNKTVSFYTYKEYAQRHNEGLKGMPKRQFMGQSAYLNNQISRKITSELNNLLR
jgi:phage gpG-like protein